MANFFWTQKQGNIGPGALSSSSMVYDSARKRVVLFGGLLDQKVTNATWEWDGSNWTQVADIGPTPRARHKMAYDSNRKLIVLFGGNTEAGIQIGDMLGDTWEWDGKEWTEVADAPLQPRVEHAMSFDEQNNVVILFGGFNGNGNLRDTWSWNGFDWTQLEDTAPDNRNAHAMCYDDNLKRILLMGGVGSQGNFSPDTWQWNGTMWTKITDIGPGPLASHSMIYSGDRVILFGGSNSFQLGEQGNTWQWNGIHWTKIQDMGPQKRDTHTMAYDSDKKRIVLFGGKNATVSLSDTWEGFFR